MPRFVLHYHDCPPGYVRDSHWDLMLEVGEMLRTWALPALPRNWSAAQAQTASLFFACAPLSDANTVSADLLGDHRREYLDYEGPVSRNRGRVARIDAGTFATIADSDHEWQVRLAGRYLLGALTLAADTTTAGQWTLTAHESD